MSYKVTFLDKTTFLGGEPNDSKWNFVANKSIVKLEYKLGKHQIIFKNFDGYNHVVERFQIMGSKPGQSGICRLLLMAKKGNKVLKLIYNFMKGKVTQERCIFGQEYRNKPHSGWKKGILTSKKPSIKII